ncbi:MAG: urease accessory protein UreD [Pseudomonadota bacterium]
MDGAVAGAGFLQADQSNHARGSLAMQWRHVSGRTRLATVAQEAPYRLMTPMVESDEPPLAVAANVSGGVVGGDRLDLSLAVRPNAALSTVGQAAEKVYRSAGPTARLRNRISVESGARLDWMPQGTILFDGVRMTRRTTIDLADDASLLYGEILIFGRHGMGERLVWGDIADSLDVSVAGNRVFADRFRLSDGMAALADRFALDGAEAAALVIVHAPERDLLDSVRDRLKPGPGLRCGATRRGPLLVLRWLGTDAAALRASVGGFWRWARGEVCDFPPRLPSVWVI